VIEVLIRARFAKLEPVRYISHLELMSTFRQSFRRAEIPVAFSRGFNPHQLLSMGPPLPVGMTGQGEYFDLELTTEMAIDDFINRVNNKLPSGLEILEARGIKGKVKSLMALLDTAVYTITMKFTGPLLVDEEKEILTSFLKQNEMQLLKHRKKKEDRLIDLRPLIYDGEVVKPGLWMFTVSTGSNGNIRPGELVRILDDFSPVLQGVPLINIDREGLFIRGDDRLYRPVEDKVIGVDNVDDKTDYS
jgi:radical SAM-linked protein